MRAVLSNSLAVICALIGALQGWLCWYAVYSTDGFEKNYASSIFFFIGLPLMLVQVLLVVTIALISRKKPDAPVTRLGLLRYIGAIESIVALIVYFK